MSPTERRRAAEESLADQENLLPKKQLLVTFTVLAITLLVYFIDQNGIGQLLPAMGADLHASQTISWAGTSALIGNTVFQVLYGRLSDLFGRKPVYLSAIAALAVSELLCGVSQNAPMLYVFRGTAGVAGGGITSMTMAIVSDIVTLQERGKYQGILGSCVGVGNMVGPLLAAAFEQDTKARWRGLFYFLAPTAAACGVLHFFMLPASMPKGSYKTGLKKIDYLGTLTSSVGLILILIPVSGGGTYFAWDSAMVISMLTIGSVFAVAFIIVEWKFAALPMLPLSLFQNTAIAALLVQNVFFGLVFYTVLYFLPLYFQNVRQFSAMRSAVLTIPLVLMQAVASSLSGQYISRTGRYGEVIFVGFVLFTVCTCLLTLFDQHFPVRYIVAVLVVYGFGNGNVFQPSIVALQAHARKPQRAIVISIRNFLRSFGGAVGLALGSAVLQNKLKASLPRRFKFLADSPYVRPDYAHMGPEERAVVIDAYARASRAVFVLLSAMAGVCMVTCLFIRDHGLIRPDEREAMEREKAAADQQAKTQASSGQVPDIERPAVASDSRELDESEGDKESLATKDEPEDIEKIPESVGRVDDLEAQRNQA